MNFRFNELGVSSPPFFPPYIEWTCDTVKHAELEIVPTSLPSLSISKINCSFLLSLPTAFFSVYCGFNFDCFN